MRGTFCFQTTQGKTPAYPAALPVASLSQQGVSAASLRHAATAPTLPPVDEANDTETEVRRKQMRNQCKFTPPTFVNAAYEKLGE